MITQCSKKINMEKVMCKKKLKDNCEYENYNIIIKSKNRTKVGNEKYFKVILHK